VLALKHAQAIYTACGFTVKSILMDGKLVPLRHDLSMADILLNTTAADEHVPKIERQIRLIKEHYECN
jgi:hypothetical protein